ncbi:hypothetical protein HDZ31DRAFT_81884 [Schizophyllum fasciatum]
MNFNGNGMFNNGFPGYPPNGNNGAHGHPQHHFGYGGNYAANNTGAYSPNPNGGPGPFAPPNPPAPHGPANLAHGAHPLRPDDTFAPQTAPTPAAQILMYAIRNAEHPASLLADALGHLARGDAAPGAAQALLDGLEGCGALLARARAAAQDARARHCRRCHREYREIDNHAGACAVEHDAPAVVPGGGWARLCCGKPEAVGAPAPATLYARHTTRECADDVRRQTTVDGVKLWTGHYVTCEQNRCHEGMQL